MTRRRSHKQQVWLNSAGLPYRLARRFIGGLWGAVSRFWTASTTVDRTVETRLPQSQEELRTAIEEWRERYVAQGDHPDVAAWKARWKFEARPFA